MTEIKFEDLLGTGAHFGHVTRKWNPNFKPGKERSSYYQPGGNNPGY